MSDTLTVQQRAELTVWHFNEAVSLLREARQYVPSHFGLAEEIDEGLPDIQDALIAAALLLADSTSSRTDVRLTLNIERLKVRLEGRDLDRRVQGFVLSNDEICEVLRLLAAVVDRLAAPGPKEATDGP